MVSESSMKTCKKNLLFATLLLIAGATRAVASAPSAGAPAALAPADLILKNGKIYTDRENGRKWAESLSIREGVIQSIGTTGAIEKEKGPATKIIDLRGKVVLPGFNDAHLHFFSGGISLARLNLTGVKSIGQFKAKLKEFAAANPLKRWIFGLGWDHTAFPGQKYPTKEDLDSVVNDRPVFLWHTDEHLAVANSKALEILHIDATTPDPEDGKILKNDKGEPMGVLLESAASEASHKVDRPSKEELRQAFVDAQEEAIKYGLTSIQGTFARENLEDCIQIVDELHKAKQLKVRISLWGVLEDPEKFAELKNKYKHIPEEWLRFAHLKGFVDGVISARTAAMNQPYSDDASTRGEPNYTQEKLSELVLRANRMGFPVALHAIGDRAVGMAAAAYAAAKKQLFNSRLRNRVEHVEVAGPAIYSQFHGTGIVASVQPSHMIYDDESENYNDARLGKERVKHAFAWKGFLKAKARMAFGTDWPVMPVNPFIGLFGAVYRQHFNGRPARGWLPEQRITLDQAIEAYTLGSAYVTSEEHVKGSIREGKFADLAVTGKDPFKEQGLALSKVPVAYTILAGKITYDGTLPALKPADAKTAAKP